MKKLSLDKREIIDNIFHKKLQWYLLFDNISLFKKFFFAIKCIYPSYKFERFLMNFNPDKSFGLIYLDFISLRTIVLKFIQSSLILTIGTMHRNTNSKVPTNIFRRLTSRSPLATLAITSVALLHSAFVRSEVVRLLNDGTVKYWSNAVELQKIFWRSEDETLDKDVWKRRIEVFKKKKIWVISEFISYIPSPSTPTIVNGTVHRFKEMYGIHK